MIDVPAVGEPSSVGWSPKANACVGLGLLRGASAQQVHCGAALHVDMWGEAFGAKARDVACRANGARHPPVRGGWS